MTNYVHVPCQWCNDTGLLDLYYVKDTYCLNCDTGKKLAGTYVEPVVTTTSMEFSAHPDDVAIRCDCNCQCNPNRRGSTIKHHCEHCVTPELISELEDMRADDTVIRHPCLEKDKIIDDAAKHVMINDLFLKGTTMFAPKGKKKIDMSAFQNSQRNAAISECIKAVSSLYKRERIEGQDLAYGRGLDHAIDLLNALKI